MKQNPFRIRGAVLLGYWGLEIDVRVPDGVCCIGPDAFRGSFIRSVILPEGLKEIRARAFFDCCNLERVNVPGTVKKIEESAFAGCSALSYVYLPDSLRKLGPRAFMDCVSLTGIVLPANLKRLEEETFAGCEKLTDVFVPESMRAVDPAAFHGTGILFPDVPASGQGTSGLSSEELRTNLWKWSIIRYPEEIRSDVVRIQAHSGDFRRIQTPRQQYDLEDYLRENWVSLIDWGCWCPSLVQLLIRFRILPRTCTKALMKRMEDQEEPEIQEMLREYYQGILREMFGEPLPGEESAPVLESSLSLPPHPFDSQWLSRKQVDAEGNVEYVLVSYLGKDSDVVIPTGRGDSPVVALADGLFLGNPDLRCLVIPDGVRSIGKFLCSGCGNLDFVRLPSTLDEIPEGAFSACPSLRDVRMTSGLKRICASAFAMCAQLKEISLPDGLIRIGDSAFCYCDSLENVPLPPTLEEIGEKAFAECRSLKNLTIPAAVHAIGETAFVSCFALENLRIELENQWARMQFPFVLGNRGTSLLWTRHDRGLRDYVIPDGVTDIGPGAFTPFLETGSLTFPASVKRISMIALPVSTKKVVFLGIPEEISLLVLDRYAPDLTIVVPSKVENGSFHDWIQTQEEHGCRIVYPEAEP